MILNARQIAALNAFSRAQPALQPFTTVGDAHNALLGGDDILFGELFSAIVSGGVQLAGDVSGGDVDTPEVTGLQGDVLPSLTADGFLKRNALNTAWEAVIYGTDADTVCQGNDARFPTATAAVTATGTDQAGAALLTTQISYVTGGNQATPNGVKLPAANSHIGETWVVFNAVSLASTTQQGVAVFPFLGDTILPNAINVRDYLQSNMCGVYISIGGGQWRALNVPMKSDHVSFQASGSWFYYQLLTVLGGLTVQGLFTITNNLTTSFPSQSPSGTTATVSWNNGISQTVDLASTTGTTTITLTNPALGGRYKLKILGKTGRLATLSPAPKTAGGTPITWTATDGAIDIAEFLWDGTSYLLTSLQQALA